MSGGSPTVNPPQDNSLQVEMARENAATAAQAAADAKAKQDEADFQTKLGTAVTNAKTTGLTYLGQRGLSANDYGSVLDSIINNTKMKVPDLDANPDSYFTNDAFASGLDDYQTLQRNNNTSQVNSTFAPGFDKSLISDNSDDSILNSILGDQRATAEQQLQYNRARGILNDSGYNTAEAALDSQGQAGLSTLQGIGSSIIGKDRSQLDDIQGNAGTAASNYTLGGPAFDVNPYYSDAQTTAGNLTGSMAGDIKSALGSTNLFDVAGAIAKGGTAQGPINLTTADTTPGVPFSQKKTQTGRGLGSTGVF